LRIRLSEKMKVWEKIFDMISQDYTFETLKYCIENESKIVHKEYRVG